MRRLWNAALDLLYPASCYACEAALPVPGFCPTCLGHMPEPSPPLCLVCGVPFSSREGESHACAACLRNPPRFRTARACATYDAGATLEHPLKSVLQRYKYSHDVTLAAPLAELLQRRLRRIDDHDVVLPVPLHPSRLRWRGFNQAVLLTRYLPSPVRARVEVDALRRVRATRPQVELDQKERSANVAGAFRVANPAAVRGKRVLLLDDVLTTGATVNECARELRRAGALWVDVVVLARALAP